MNWLNVYIQLCELNKDKLVILKEKINIPALALAIKRNIRSPTILVLRKKNLADLSAPLANQYIAKPSRNQLTPPPFFEKGVGNVIELRFYTYFFGRSLDKKPSWSDVIKLWMFNHPRDQRIFP